MSAIERRYLSDATMRLLSRGGRKGGDSSSSSSSSSSSPSSSPPRKTTAAAASSPESSCNSLDDEIGECGVGECESTRRLLLGSDSSHLPPPAARLRMSHALKTSPARPFSSGRKTRKRKQKQMMMIKETKKKEKKKKNERRSEERTRRRHRRGHGSKVEGEEGGARAETKEQSGALLDIARIKRLPKLPVDHFNGGTGLVADKEDGFGRKEFQGTRGGALDQAFANENGWLPSAVV